MRHYDPETNIMVEDGVPVPPHRGRSKLPWRALKPGQSFLLKASPADRVRVQRGLASVGGWWARHLNRKYTTRQCEDGVRVWRVK